MLALGPMELTLILVIVLVIFGAGKLPQIGDALGKSIKNFKRAADGRDEIDVSPRKELEADRDARSAAVIDRDARSAAVIDRDARSAAVIDRDARSAAVIDREARSAAVIDRKHDEKP